MPTTASTQAQAKTKPNNAPIVLAISKYSSDAQDVIPTWRAGEPMWNVRVSHNAYPNVESGVLAATKDFLAAGHAADAAMPASLQDLRRDVQIVVQMGRVDETNTTHMPLEGIRWGEVDDETEQLLGDTA